MSYFPVGQTLATLDVSSIPKAECTVTIRRSGQTVKEPGKLCEGVCIPVSRECIPAAERKSTLSVPVGSQKYFELLLRAQGSKEGQAKADQFKVMWRVPSSLGGSVSRRPHKKPFPISDPATFSAYISRTARLLAANTKGKKKDVLSVVGWEVRKKFKGTDADPKNVSEHRAQVIMANCAAVGVPEHLLECCALDMQRRGMDPERYMEMINENDPIVMACLAPADQAHKAAKRRKLIMISAVAAAGAVGLSLVMKKRKKS